MTTATARLYLRLESRDKDRIVQAAALRGMEVSAFMRDAVLREAEAAIAADAVVTLSEGESRRLLAALDDLLRSNARLKSAMDAALAVGCANPGRGIDQVVDDVDVTLMTRRDAPNAIVMCQEHYDSLMETAHLLRSPANVAHLERSIAQARAGKLKSRKLADESE